MKLIISTPFARVLEIETNKVHVPTTLGDWCILPRHIDMVIAVSPGVLTYNFGDRIAAVAIDAGLLVKSGAEITLAVGQAIVSDTLADLTDAMERQFFKQIDDERSVQAALAHIELGLIRNLRALEQVRV